MKIYIEFPMNLLQGSNGSDSVYQTLDDHVTDLVVKPFKDRDIPSKIVKIDFIDATPNTNDELVRYEVDAEMDEREFKPNWLLEALQEEGFEKGLTIKDHHGESLYNDEYTADIPLRRKMQVK
jgi:hypothetical protein